MNKNDLDPTWVDTQLRTANWHTSSLSSGGSTCVQVAFLDHGLVDVFGGIQTGQRQPLLSLRRLDR